MSVAVAALAAHEHDVSGFGVLEWVALALAAIAAAWVIWRAVVLTVRPGEDDPHHIKRTILDDEPPPEEGAAEPEEREES